MDEFVYITDDTYTKKQLLRMEHLLLKVLGFDLTAPTINQFLLQYIQRRGICMRTENFARVWAICLLGLRGEKGSLKEDYVHFMKLSLQQALNWWLVCRDFWINASWKS